jgi:lysozyme
VRSHRTPALAALTAALVLLGAHGAAAEDVPGTPVDPVLAATDVPIPGDVADPVTVALPTTAPPSVTAPDLPVAAVLSAPSSAPPVVPVTASVDPPAVPTAATPSAAPTPSAEPAPAEIPQARTLAEAPNAGPWGTDMSRWQHPDGEKIDWSAMAGERSGPAFVFVKGSEGRDGAINPFRDQDIADARTLGSAVGLYHYAEPALPVVEDAVAQAEVAAQPVTGQPREGTLPLVLDLESNPNDLSPEELATWALTWLDRARELTGRTPVVYTYPEFFRTTVAPDPAFADYPLWIAHYGVGVTAPRVPAPWSAWTFWQYSAKGALSGIGADADLDVFAGSQQELDLLAGRLPADPVQATRTGVAILGDALLAAVTGN